ncbi:hypothetical protein [Bacteroides sp.]|uniref:hypothetical protein n=1 Tax=Bacteroides sp. TaxID=29523 RepID=UPI002FC64956
MSYAKRFYTRFASRKGIAYTLEIEELGYIGSVTELTGSGEEPFSVEVDMDDFLYIPVRSSTATIRLVGSDYLTQLYATAYQRHRVVLKRGNSVVWCGFVSPELYTQDYSTALFELEVECVSPIRVLEFVNYEPVQAGTMQFVSLLDVIKRCVLSAKGCYGGVYLPHVYAAKLADIDKKDNVLSQMMISEQNFFDEENKPMSYLDVLTEVCRFLNWTCCDWKGDLYFVDIDHTGVYRKYDQDFITYTECGIGNIKGVQEIGFAGDSHTLDLLSGYNKCSIKTSNYPAREMVTEEDFDKLTEAVSPPDAVDGNAVSHKIIYLPDRIDMRQYHMGYGDYITEYEKDYVKENKNDANDFLGAFPVRFCEYKMVESGGNWSPDISNYSYTDAIQIRIKPPYKSKEDTTNLYSVPSIVIKGDNMVYPYGAFCISYQWAFVNNPDMGVLLFDGYYMDRSFKCSFRVGNKWWDGRSFIASDTPVTFDIDSSESGTDKNKWFSVKNTKTLQQPYDGMSGYLIPFASDLVGDIEFSMYAPKAYQFHGSPAPTRPYGVVVKDLKLEYKSMSSFSKESKKDRIYSNAINESYINELEEIETKISTYNNDGACYSKIVIGNKYLESNLYCSIENTSVRLEELLIRRIVRRYNATKIKLNQVLVLDNELAPFTRLSDKFMSGRTFLNIGGYFDFASDTYRCTMIEL